MNSFIIKSEIAEHSTDAMNNEWGLISKIIEFYNADNKIIELKLSSFKSLSGGFFSSENTTKNYMNIEISSKDRNFKNNKKNIESFMQQIFNDIIIKYTEILSIDQINSTVVNGKISFTFKTNKFINKVDLERITDLLKNSNNEIIKMIFSKSAESNFYQQHTLNDFSKQLLRNTNKNTL